MAELDGVLGMDEETIELLANNRSIELLRAWVSEGGPATILIDAYSIPPEMFGMLLADCARHAALAYAAADGNLSESSASEQILGSLWRELGDPTTPLTTISPGGRVN